MTFDESDLWPGIRLVYTEIYNNGKEFHGCKISLGSACSVMESAILSGLLQPVHPLASTGKCNSIRREQSRAREAGPLRRILAGGKKLLGGSFPKGEGKGKKDQGVLAILFIYLFILQN